MDAFLDMLGRNAMVWAVGGGLVVIYVLVVVVACYLLALTVMYGGDLVQWYRCWLKGRE